MNLYFITGFFLLFIFLSGFWLSRSGKPYRAGIFNLHKLIGLALGVYLIVSVYRSHQALPLNAAQVAVIALTGLIFLGLIAAGGLLGVDDAGNLPNLSGQRREWIRALHRRTPYLALLATAATLYLLLNPGS